MQYDEMGCWRPRFDATINQNLTNNHLLAVLNTLAFSVNSDKLYIDSRWSVIQSRKSKHLTENKVRGQWSSTTWKHQLEVLQKVTPFGFCSNMPQTKTNTNLPTWSKPPAVPSSRSAPYQQLRHAIAPIYWPWNAGIFRSVEHQLRILRKTSTSTHSYTLFTYRLLHRCLDINHNISILFWEGFLLTHTAHLLTFEFHIRSKDLRALATKLHGPCLHLTIVTTQTSPI